MPELKDNETRMTRFDKLSEERKAEIRKAAQDELREAESQRKTPFGSRVFNALNRVNPLIPQKMRDENEKFAAESAARREQRYTQAKQEASMSDEERTKRPRLYSDNKVHKIGDEPLFNKGGKVSAYAKGGTVSSRADGCAQRGKTKGRVI